MTLPWPPILVITDRKQCADRIEVRAEALFRGGCRFLSLREKDMAGAERHALLGGLAALGRAFGATVCVHDDLAAAQAWGTGLHLPADGDAAEARRALGAGILIGQSCHSRAEIAAAAQAGADYATMGPIFESASKPGYAPAENPADAIDAAGLPVLALGGITPDKLAAIPKGFAGIAIMGAAMTAADPRRWFADLLLRWRSLNGQEAGFS